MAGGYEVASPVSFIAHRLIRDHHKRLKDLRVEYLYLIEKPKKKPPPQQQPVGEVKVISGLNAYLAATTDEPFGEPFFVLLLRKQLWDKIDDERKREAVIDHYLCRMFIDEKGGLKKREFDVAAYQENVTRYGLWYEGLEEMLRAGDQYKLPLAAGDSTTSKAGKGGVRLNKKATHPPAPR